MHSTQSNCCGGMSELQQCQRCSAACSQARWLCRAQGLSSCLLSKFTSAATSSAQPALRFKECSQMEQSSCLSLQVDNETDGISSPCQCCQGGVYQSEFVQHAQKKGMLELPGLLWGGHGLSLLLEAQGDRLQSWWLLAVIAVQEQPLTAPCSAASHWLDAARLMPGPGLTGRLHQVILH